MFDEACSDWVPAERLEFFYQNKNGKKRNPWRSPIGWERTISEVESQEEVVCCLENEIADPVMNMETIYHSPNWCCGYCVVEDQPHYEVFCAEWNS